MISRTYLRESLLWIGALGLGIVPMAWLVRHAPTATEWRLLALVPVVAAICAGLWVELRQVARMDELQRHLYLVSTLVGSMLAMLFCAVAYFGELLELWERVAPIYVVAVIGLGFLLGWIGARRRYQ